MNQFDYKLNLEEINRETKKTVLRKLMSRYMSRANSSYQAHYAVDRYSANDLEKAKIALMNFNLAKKTVERWEELGWDTKGVPNYILTKYIAVDIRVSLQHAVKLLGSKDNVQ